MHKMVLRPDADGYSETEGEEVIRVDLDGGAGRYRTDKVGAAKTVTVKWTMNPTQYQYWRAFYATRTKNGALPFLCDLVSEDGSEPVEHTCHFLPGSVTKPLQQGLTYVQAATLEVVPNARNKEADEALLDLYDIYGGGLGALLASLGRLVTVTMPENIS
jgi:hypothetical protein